jgi:type I restriction enzyme S subunit
MAESVRMAKYEAYKDSGVDWLGDIPSDWNIAPGFKAYSENKRNNKGLKEEQVLSLSYGKIVIKPKEKLVGLVPESFETYQIVEPGDLIIRCMDLQNDKTSLRTGLSENHGIITSAYLNLKIKKNFDSKFLYYYLHSLDTTKVLYKFGTGLRQNLSFQDFFRLPIFDIPKTLQTAIANFLDKKTAQIDEAIAIKQSQIALLKERKQIIIQQAVTQGLNPDIPIKDSAVDWIGEVPEHWTISKIGHYARVYNGSTPSRDVKR